MKPARVRRLQRQIGRQLLGWAAGSVVAGLPLLRHQRPFWRAFGLQQAAWGAIDGAIAVAGELGARRNAPQTEQEAAAEAAKLRRLLWINAGLDVGYVLAGAWLAGRKQGQPAGEAYRGHGAGVMVQGGFLLIFDTIHALRLGAALKEERL